ncbi:8113_t:CDS:2 [Ambispora gerdemannii]|uniref:8113_t:CDS:1 n=1 Tax=Ambispora gerdemannii TaxID=144530 RepID=A0A9N8V114_9GLOM|nr:8113_t:CDS:2 [Ambispora gerdemannii]
MVTGEQEPLVFSAYPKKQTKQPWFLRNPIIRNITLATPFVLGFILYRYVISGPFLPLSCQIIGLECPSIQVSGYTDPEFASIRKIFAENFENGDEIGASVTMFYEGVQVVELQGGVMDTRTQRPYDRDTLQLVFSSSKSFASTVIARFVEKGLLDYNEKIATYWPEFAQGNKENVTLGDLMVHRAGVSFIDHHTMKIEDLTDMDHLAKILQEQPHNWNGVPTRAYHACTRGWYLNEIVRRVDPQHRTIGKIIDQELSDSYDIEFHLSLPEKMDSRVATIYEYPLLRVLGKMIFPSWLIAEPLHEIFKDMINPRSIPFKSLVHSAPNQAQPGAYNRREFRVSEGPSYSGITNSRSMGKLAALLANKGQPIRHGEPVLLSETAYELALKPLPPVYDAVLHETMVPTVGGYGVWRLEGLEDIELLGWGGSGGSLLFWNNEYKIAFAYCMNAFNTALLGDKRAKRMLREFVDIVKAKHKSSSSSLNSSSTNCSS